jgi:DnaJ-class molecular chaperone
MEPTLYAILGVAPDADQAAIVQAYAARSYKADNTPSSDRAMFTHAYLVLSDTGRRVAYDFALSRAAEEQNGYEATHYVTVTLAEACIGSVCTLNFHYADGQPYEVEISIPPGAHDGQVVLVPGAGGPSKDGQRRGNLRVIVCIHG